MPLTEIRERTPKTLARRIFAACFVAALLLVGGPSLFAQEKRLSVYAPQMYYQVSVADRSGNEYVGLLELLEPLGKVESRLDGKKWKLRFTGSGATIETEFQDGKRKGKVRGTDFDLPANFLLQGDRGYVPINSLGNLLPRLLERTVELHAAPRRLFVGGAAMKLVLDLKHAPNRLIASFPNPVSPQIASDGTHVRVTFTRDPVTTSGVDVFSYSEPPFASSNLSETNGSAILDLVGTVPLQATFSDGGKTLTIAAAASQPAPANSAANAPTPATTSSPAETTPAVTPGATTAKPRSGGRIYVVALDAGHGGDERGAQLTETLNEKDVTLSLTRRIQHELESRGISVFLVRAGDSTITPEQRAISTNSSRSVIYVSIHAATLGTGLRIFTAMLPSTETNPRAFLPWNTAQASFGKNSSSLAAAIASECTTRKLPVKSFSAPVRPLNNIAAAAIAIEIAPQADTVESISDAKYQQVMAAAVAAGIASARNRLEAQ
jgi:N-acetylmuramoyl-L-alanine amidase